MREFTPGPWRAQELPPREITLKRRHWAIGQVNAPAKVVGLAFGETDANARLIAAAPELYEALCRLIPPEQEAHMEESPGDFHEDWHNARAALTKARRED